MTIRIELELRGDRSERVDVRRFRLDECLTRSEAEIANVPVAICDVTVRLGDLFSIRISTASSDLPECIWAGDSSTVDYLGFEHQRGRMIVQGSVGHHCGACMSGGSIEVNGEAGNCVGAAVGSRGVGMRGGRIWILGSAGNDVGMRMRRGEILVAGDVGRGLGSLMIAGTIRCLGQPGASVGYAMRRGTIVCDHPQMSLPDGFSQPRKLQTPFQTILMNHHDSIGFTNQERWERMGWAVARGHAASHGQGEIWFRNDSFSNDSFSNDSFSNDSFSNDGFHNGE